MTPEFGKKQVQRAAHIGAAQAAGMAKAMYEKYGDEALAILRENAFRDGVKAYTAIAKRAGIRTGDGTLEDWLKLEKLLSDTVVLPPLEYESEYTPERSVFRLTFCPYAEAYKAIFPDYCRKVAIGAERAIAAAINPNLVVHVERYVPEGDVTCDVVCEWKPGTNPNR